MSFSNAGQVFTHPYKVQFLVKQTLAILLHKLMKINIEYFSKCTLKRLRVLFLFRMLGFFLNFLSLNNIKQQQDRREKLLCCSGRNVPDS